MAKNRGRFDDPNYIKRLDPDPDRRWLKDDGPSGEKGLYFVASRTEKGTGAWFARYTAPGTKARRRYKLGNFPPLTVAKARKAMRKLRVEYLDAGKDPAQERSERQSAPTVADLWDWFEKDRLPKKRPATQRDYDAMWRNYIKPSIGWMKVADVSYDDIERLHRTITNGKHRGARRPSPYVANRTHALLHHLFKLAIAPKKWRTDNPATGLVRNKETKRTRYLKDDEIQRLLAALDAEPNRCFADLFMLAWMTGSRIREPMLAKWANIDLDAATWTKPPETIKTGEHAEEGHTIMLSPKAAALLKDLLQRQLARAARERREPSEWVFEGDTPNAPVVFYNRAWKRVCKAASIENFRVHDLRHTAASMLISAGHTLPQIGEQLGHKSAQTTMRYAHLLEEGKRATAAGIEQGIFGSDAKPDDEPESANVVPIRQG